MKHLEGKYNIALDPGVANLGYCVTTLNHDILKIDDNKALFGTIKYPEAETAAGRRGCRTARRNNDHKKIRVDALQDYFEEEITKIDPEFLTRLNESRLVTEDKSTDSEYVLFNDEDYSDKQYYDEYPTIQHLIKDIIEGKKIKDIRLIYLAILSEYKHRGNMNSKIRINPNNDIPLNELISDYCSQAEKLFDIDLKIDEKEYEEVFFSDDKITNKGKALCEMSGYATNSTEGMLCRLIINATIDFKNILELNDSLKVKLSDLFDEEKDDQLRSETTSDIYDFIDLARNLYSAILLKKFLGPHKYPSQAKVALYDKHKADLIRLKKVLDADKKSYNEIFNTSDDNSYKGYLKNSNKNAKPFFAKIKTILERLCEAGMVSDADTNYILNEIENGTFLPKQRTAENAIIPNQLYEAELREILNHTDAPFLDEIGESGQPIREEICMWFTFRVPYFVGPLSEESEKNGGNGWIVRREEGKITPWNLEEKVNIPETIKKFIVRMIRDCTYLPEEKGLPKSSLLYQEYMVLNEINNMKVAGVRVSKEIKNAIYSLYKEGNVTVSKIQKCLLEEGYISNKDEFFVEGEKLTAQLSSYTAIKQIIGDKISDRKTVEKFIFMSTIYGNEKSMLKKYAKKEFPIYSEEELNMLCRLNFKEWGNLSEKFLTMKGFCGTFIEIMEKTTQNLMEILYNHRYGFLDIVEAARPTYPDILDITYDDLNIYNMSGPVKRMVWQSIKQIQYIIRRTNAEPANIYIESTRSTEESERTVATKDMFIKKFKDIFKGEELQYWTGIVEKLDEAGLLKTKKAYLYLTQLGIDMYTGNPIPLECILEDDDEYDCDHIIPKSIKIDNSPQNNLVLTARDTNIKKDKYYPLSQAFDQSQIDKVHPLWVKLKKSKLITAEKYQRLIRTEPLSNKEKADFISRQIVEIGQNVKVLADILRASLKNTNVIFVKSSNIADFRQIFKIPKCRMINEYHHAHDAYLTEVVGSVFTAKFTQNPLNFIYSKEPYNISKMYDKHVVRGKFVYWFPSKKDDEGNYIPSPGSTYEKVLKNLTESSEPMFFRVPYTTKGKLFNTNIVGKNEISNPNLYMPIKKTNPKLADVTKYGGYGNIKGAYFFIVEHTDKKKRVQTIEQVYVYELKALNEGKISLLDICKRRGLKLPMIINPKILPGSKFGPGYISGRSGSSILFHNAKQYNFPLDDIEYLSKVEKNKLKYLTKDKNEKMYDKFVKVLKEHGYVEIYSKKVLDVVFNGKERFSNLTLEDQCTVLQQIAAFFQVGSANISLKLIGGSANTGKIQRSRVLTSNI